jgi:hypothetical protein
MPNVDVIEEINVNLIPGGVMPVCHTSQYDKVIRKIKVNFFNGNTPFEIPNYNHFTRYVVILDVKKPDGHVITSEMTLPESEPHPTWAYIETTEQMTAVAGKNICEIKIQYPSVDPDEVIGTANFIMEVEKDPIDGGVTSASEIHDLEQQIRDITASEMHNYYTKSETYSKGEINSTVDTINQQIGEKADSDSVYTKSQTNEILSTKADSSSVYTKSQTDEMLSAKADAATTFTKNEVTTRLLEKADLDQIIIKDGDINYVGSTSEPVLPYFYEVRTTSSSTVSVRETPSTMGSILTTAHAGDILLIEEITAGEVINHVPLWGYVVIQSGTESIEGYISMYYLRRLYNVTFNRTAYGSVVKKLAFKILPDQLGAGDPSFNNERPIKLWTSVKVRDQSYGEIHEIEFANIPDFSEGIVGGTAEVADGDGYLSNDYEYVDLGDLGWLALGDMTDGRFATYAPISDILMPDSTSDIADIMCTKLDTKSQDDVIGKVSNQIVSTYEHNGANRIVIYATDFVGKTENQVQEMLKGVKLAYRLTSSHETDLEGQTLSLVTREGTNWFWTNCGNITECKLDNIKVPGDTKIITGTLEAGQTTLALQDAAITDDAMYDLYTDTYGVNPTAVSVESGVITLTFEVQSSDVGVKIKVS